jgi:hypothetical protein
MANAIQIEAGAAGAPRIDFIGVGVQKAGTSTLYEMLRRHPNISLSRVKEVHFFDTDEFFLTSPDYDTYHKNFDFTAGSVLRGEFTPRYIVERAYLERIARYRADIKLIAIFRDPIERAFSQWKMHRGAGVQPLDFGTAIRSDEPESPGATAFGVARVFRYVDRGFYGLQLAQLLSLFSREKVLLLDYRDLQKDQSGLMSKLSRFLLVEQIERMADGIHVNKSVWTEPIEPADERYLADIYRNDFVEFLRLSGLRCEGWRMNAYL